MQITYARSLTNEALLLFAALASFQIQPGFVIADDPETPEMRLDLDLPDAFVDSYFSDPKQLIVAPESVTGAIDGPRLLVFTKGKQNLAIETELITFRKALGLSTIAVNQIDTSLDKANDDAIRLCKMSGADTQGIEKWVRNERAGANEAGAVARATSKSPTGTHAIEVRRSVAAADRWWVMYKFVRRSKDEDKR